MDFDNEMKPDHDESLHFYYNREERLKNAPKNVQDYYNGNFELQKGFKVLFKNKTNKYLLITLLALTAFGFFFSRINSSKNKGTLDSHKMELSGFLFEDEVFTTVKISEKQRKENSERAPVNIVLKFQFINSDNQIFDIQEYSLLMDSSEKTQVCKTTDFDTKEVMVTASNGSKELVLSASVKH